MERQSVAKRKTHHTAKERETMLLLSCRATSRRRASAGPRAELMSLGCLANQCKNFVEISEPVSSNHVKVIEAIAEQVTVGGCTKNDALGLKAIAG